MTLCNMVIEAGGKNGVIAPDQVTLDFVNARDKNKKPYTVVKSDAGAKFDFEKVYDVRKMQPVVAKPHSPDNKATAAEVSGTKLDRAYIGSCTGGKMTDFRAAAKILQGKSVKIDTFVVPATSEIARTLKTEKLGEQTLEEECFLNAGAKTGRRVVARRAWADQATRSADLNQALSCFASAPRTATSPAAWDTRKRASILRVR